MLFDIISFVFGLACIVPNITLTARRLHDVGLSALWIVWYILALVVITVLGLIFTGIAAGAIRLAQAVFYDEKAVLPVSKVLHGEYGL